MNKEQDRLESFQNYPDTEYPNFNAASFAKVGFFATGKGEEIRCYFCERTLPRLLPEDPEPVTLHLRTNSSCPLIRRHVTDNVELPPFELDSLLPPAFNDTCGIGVVTKYPEFVFFESRKRSFQGWPLEKPKPDDLARSGFFSLGESDKVACFSCGLGLMQFDSTDDAFEEHARWGATCDYLKQTKGDDFIREVHEKYNT